MTTLQPSDIMVMKGGKVRQNTQTIAGIRKDHMDTNAELSQRLQAVKERRATEKLRRELQAEEDRETEEWFAGPTDFERRQE